MRNLTRYLGVVLVLFGTAKGGFVLLESSFSSAGSESNSSSFLLKQGLGQSLAGESSSSSFFEQAGFYNWLLFVSQGVGVKEKDTKGGFPLVYRFLPLMPNPARGEVKIVFEIPTESRVTLRIYDPAGRLVRTILDDVKKSGRYKLIWDGRDKNGRALPPGIYFLMMEGGSFRKTQKLILM